MLNKNLQKWVNHVFSTGCGTGEDYLKFQRAMKADLKNQVAAKGLDLLSFNGNHYCFSAVVINPVNEKLAYVAISDVRIGKWVDHTLYRTMQNKNDWTGGINRYCSWDKIGESVAVMLRK